MSAQTGRPSMTRPSPIATAAQCGLRWNTPGDQGLMTWDVVLDLAVVAYWARRPNPARGVVTVGG